MKVFNSIVCAFGLMILVVSCKAQVTNSKNVIMQNTSNLTSLHDSTKALSVQLFFKGAEGITRSLQIKQGGQLPEHTTQTEAILVCVSGEVRYEDEANTKHTLKAGDYYRIQPKVKHWVNGIQDSQLLLIK